MNPTPRRRPSPRPVTLLVLAITGLVLLAGCGGPGAKPAASPPQDARLPERTGEQADYELLDALLSSPVTVELPPGVTARPPQEATTTVLLPSFALPLPPPPAWRGGALMVLKGPVAGDWFGFTVYATAADAEAVFRAVEAIRRPPDYETFTPTGFDSPAHCRAETAPDATLITGPGGVTVCLVLAGNVLVASGTKSTDDPRRGNDERTVALVRAALAHLQAMQAELARFAAAAPATRPVRVGLLTQYPWPVMPKAREFRERLTALGWVRGRDLAIEYRFGEGHVERLPELATELVRERVDLIVTLDLPSAQAAKTATAGTTIPLVFLLWDGADPVASGLVPSLARPGENLTGVGFPVTTGLAAKRLDLLIEALPHVARVGAVVGAADGPLWQELEETARARGVELVPVVVRGPDDMEAAVAAAKASGAQALLQAPRSSITFPSSLPLLASAERHRLPVVYNDYNLGGLLSYVPSSSALLARGAEYVDLVLRGTPPAQLPVELVREYDLTIGLVVSQRFGLTIAPSVLAKATELIEQGTPWPRRVR
jgi:putative tryptophan/tyrosine transport system substrate-binding protein